MAGLCTEMALSAPADPISRSSNMEEHTSNGSDDNLGSHDVETGELAVGTEFDEEMSAANQQEVCSKKSFFKKWAEAFVMVPFNITINAFAALWGFNGNAYFPSSSFRNHFFFFVVMLNFYVSIVGIILWPVFPAVARGLHLISFLCVLLSLTILFGTLLPNELTGLPWIFLAFVVFLVVILLVNAYR